MTGFEPLFSGVGSDNSTNRATTTAHQFANVLSPISDESKVDICFEMDNPDLFFIYFPSFQTSK